MTKLVTEFRTAPVRVRINLNLPAILMDQELREKLADGIRALAIPEARYRVLDLFDWKKNEVELLVPWADKVECPGMTFQWYDRATRIVSISLLPGDERLHQLFPGLADLELDEQLIFLLFRVPEAVEVGTELDAVLAIPLDNAIRVDDELLPDFRNKFRELV